VIRGDVNFIRIGEQTNIQDLSVLHVTNNTYPLILGNGVTVGHNAILHGATIKEFCLVGMGAIVLDNAVIGPYALIAAGSVVLENAVIPEGVMAAGIPAKVIRPLTEQRTNVSFQLCSELCWILRRRTRHNIHPEAVQ